MARKDRISPGSTELDEALDKSLALLERGRAAEDCLARFPEQSEELRPLLEVAAWIRRVPAPTPSPTGIADGKRRMLEALAQKKAARPTVGAQLRAWITGLFEAGAEQRVDVQRLLRSAAVAAAVVVLIGVATIAVGSWRGMTIRQEAVLSPEDGLVEILPSGADAWHRVRENVPVQAGDRIRTGAAGAAELVFFDGSTTELRPVAELTIVRMASQRNGRGKAILLHQWLGQVHNQVQPLVDEASRFRVETASAVVSVRGTSFTLTVEPDGTTLVEVEEGVVEVQTVEASTLISGGEEILVQSPLASTTPTQVAPSDVDETQVSPSPTGSSEPLEVTETAEPSELYETELTEEPSPTSTTREPTSAPTEGPSPTPTQGSTSTETDEPSPTETEEPSPTDTDEPSPTETEEPSPTDTDEPSPTEPPPTATEEPQPTATEQQPPTATDEPSPTATEQPPPTATEEPPPTATEQPPPTATEEPPPTATEQPPPTATEEPPPTETKVKETPPGHTNTPEPPGQTKTPPGQEDKVTQTPDGDADSSSRSGVGSLQQNTQTSFVHRALLLLEQMAAPIWLGVLVVVLPLSILFQDER